jgi:ATP-dependent RNA circularization protein (DNA/RNA ligase family)
MIHTRRHEPDASAAVIADEISTVLEYASKRRQEGVMLEQRYLALGTSDYVCTQAGRADLRIQLTRQQKPEP